MLVRHFLSHLKPQTNFLSYVAMDNENITPQPQTSPPSSEMDGYDSFSCPAYTAMSEASFQGIRNEDLPV